MTARVASRIGWGVFGLALVCGAATLVLAATRGSERVPEDLGLGASQIIVGSEIILGLGLLGALIVGRHPRNAVGWIWCAAALGAGLSGLSDEYAVRAVYIDGSLPAGEWAAWVSSWVWIATIPVLGVLMPLLYPTGRLPSPRWRPALWLSVAALMTLFAGFAFRTGALPDFAGVENPAGFIPEEVEAGGVVFVLALFGALASHVYRVYAAGPEERRKILLVFAAAILYGLLLALSLAVDSDEAPWLQYLVDASVGLVIAAAGIAILRHRLYELDLVVNRTLVYTTLTAGVVAIYVGLVTGAGELADSTGIGISLAATVVVAVAVQPLRQVLQRRVDRLMYGDRGDPYHALSGLGERLGGVLDPDQVLPGIVTAVAEGLKLPYVAVELREGDEPRIAAAHGDAAGRETIRLPLTHRGQRLGDLIVAGRSGDQSLAPADLRLLADLARQAGIAAAGVRMTAELRRSGERLAAAGEEERRRLRRDLHDGLGPLAAGISLEIDSARQLIASDSAAARELLARLPGDINEAIADIRRITHDLRPPALDDLGLLGAIREGADRLAPADSGLEVAVDGPAALRPLPAAVEVAAYRIALEALTNVVRHAQAAHAVVRIRQNGALEVEVRDDGAGLATDRGPGVGLSSMRERAEELAGSLALESPREGGTAVRATLPLAPATGSEREPTEALA